MIDWRVTQCAAHDVTFRSNIFTEADDVLALAPNVVIAATGGLPAAPAFAEGALTVSSWDILSDDFASGESVLLWDAAGGRLACKRRSWLPGPLPGSSL